MVGEQELPFESPKGTRRAPQSSCMYLWFHVVQSECLSLSSRSRSGETDGCSMFPVRPSVCLPLWGGVGPAGEGVGRGQWMGTGCNSE